MAERVLDDVGVLEAVPELVIVGERVLDGVTDPVAVAERVLDAVGDLEGVPELVILGERVLDGVCDFVVV